MKVYLMMQRDLNQYCVERTLDVFSTKELAEYGCDLQRVIDEDCDISKYEYYTEEMEVIGGY